MSEATGQPINEQIASQEQMREQLYLRAVTVQNKMLKESVDLWDARVDPMDAIRGDNGELWTPVSGVPGPTGPGMERHGFWTVTELMIARVQCQWLTELNQFAICGHENRINYIVGTGHTYAVTAKQGQTVPDKLIRKIQKVIDDWCKADKWPLRQQENVRRFDRDGEVFIRYFVGPDGVLKIRYINPWELDREQTRTDAPFGLLTDLDDVETVNAYIVGGAEVDAANVQHRKANVDRTVRRGQPLFYPVRPALLRADKLLRNMAAASDIQTSIAMIRKHMSATSSAAATFRSATADATRTNGVTGNQEFIKRYPPGSIIDSPAGMEYEFPSDGLDASQYVAVLAAVLRGVCARLNMPEFMLTADASNGNYGSTMVAEGPNIKQFEKEQATQQTYDLEILDRVIQAAIDRNELPADILDNIQIHVGLPKLQVRDGLKDMQIAQIGMGLQILSPQTATAESERDFHQEQENIEAFKKAHPDWLPPTLGNVGDQGNRGDKNSADNGDANSGNNKNSAKKVARKLESVDALTVLEELYP